VYHYPLIKIAIFRLNKKRLLDCEDFEVDAAKEDEAFEKDRKAPHDFTAKFMHHIERGEANTRSVGG